MSGEDRRPREPHLRPRQRWLGAPVRLGGTPTARQTEAAPTPTRSETGEGGVPVGRYGDAPHHLARLLHPISLTAPSSESALLNSASVVRIEATSQRLVRRVDLHRGAPTELEPGALVGGEGIEPPASSV